MQIILIIGFLSGIFFIGYLIFEIPSNVILQRVWARVWISRIMISWGIVVIVTAAASSAFELAALRFILGVTEAGFFPGLILYLTFWFRQRELAQAVALFMAALAISNIIGAPVSTRILDNIAWVGIPLGDAHVIFYFGFCLIELACILGFIIVLASLILYQSGNLGGKTFTFRGALSELHASFGSLAALSVGMAFIATIAWDNISHSQFFGSIISSIMQLFWLPYAYYEPQNWTLGAIYSSANFFSLEIMAINIILFLAALYLVPVVVLERKGLIPATATSLTLLKRTWRMVLGCLIVFGLIAVGVFAVGILIGQSLALLNHDYDFFISRSRGYLPMMAVCYGFIISCWVLMTAGFTAAGVAVSDLYRAGMESGIAEENLKKPEPVV